MKIDASRDLDELRQELVNIRGFIKSGGLEVRVAILDLRRSFGRIDLLVSPIHGSGEKWIQSGYFEKEVER